VVVVHVIEECRRRGRKDRTAFNPEVAGPQRHHDKEDRDDNRETDEDFLDHNISNSCCVILIRFVLS
jgi:hypothetical protein